MRTLGSLLAIVLLGAPAWAGDAVTISDKVAKITQTYQDDLESLAKDPAVVADVKAADAKTLDEAAAKALQAKWTSESKDLAYAKPYLDNASAAAFKKAQQRAPLSKVFSLDKAGNVVSTVPKCHDFIHGFEPKFLQPFQGGKTVVNKPSIDLTSKKASVQISVPVKDGDAVVGVLVGTFALDDVK